MSLAGVGGAANLGSVDRNSGVGALYEGIDCTFALVR